jgi:hypothetical protein
MSELAERAVRAVRAYALPAALAGVSLVAVLAGSLFRDVYYGIPDSIAVAAITATCQPAAGRTSCDVAIVRLKSGSLLSQHARSGFEPQRHDRRSRRNRAIAHLARQA